MAIKVSKRKHSSAKFKIIHFSKIHIFEPVPDYNKQLENTWKKYNTQYRWNATVHKYGLGNNDRDGSNSKEKKIPSESCTSLGKLKSEG